MAPDPRPAKRIKDPGALRTARVTLTECAACGRPPGSIHHLIPRSEGGDDVAGNLVALCGSGTTGCHGAHHGNPYEVRHGLVASDMWTERRTAEWVNRRIGKYIAAHRPGAIEYVQGKLGKVAGADYLLRHYYLKGTM